MKTIVRHIADEVNYAIEGDIFQKSYLSGDLLSRPSQLLDKIAKWNLIKLWT